MDIFAWLWLGWLAAFAVVEGVAIFNGRRGDTLSEKVWSVVKKGGKGGSPRLVVWLPFAGFLAWLVVHFLFGL